MGYVVRVFLILCLVFSVASCGLFNRNPGRNAETENIIPFRAKLSTGQDDREFFVNVQNEGEGVDAVRESVRFEATKYCLFAYGASDADWQIDPATNDWAFTQESRGLTFRGRCTAR
ncbi:hypothetical protein [Litoreibacter roseus]|uniref:Uncharacterized protein n=1 Tax=Litoreibacter roseus TaxID=2601869 RepID=A0A6N6JHJ8_9RHOB|nr:hypothetical protein [Litoreibacter roseus]GFE65801.1 hypothetical protein KIN_28750 [Litoreibacter roseus]